MFRTVFSNHILIRKGQKPLHHHQAKNVFLLPYILLMIFFEIFYFITIFGKLKYTLFNYFDLIDLIKLITFDSRKLNIIIKCMPF